MKPRIAVCSARQLPLIALWLGVFFLHWQQRSVAVEPTQRPNIVLIVADDLGYGDVGCFGQKTLKTPRLDAMAQQGIRLTQFYAGSTVCAPSRSVLMTGRHTGHTIVRGNSAKPIVISPRVPTLASVLKEAGYATACVGKWGIGTPDDLSNPNDVGFDHFFGYVNMWHAHNYYPEFLIWNGQVEPLQNVVADRWRKWQDPQLPQAGRGVAVQRVDYAPDLLAKEALRWVREHHRQQADSERRQPFFLYFAMNLPHANNEAGKTGMEVPDLGEFASRDWPAAEKAFAAMVSRIDHQVGQMLDLVEELKIHQETLVIFTSDNGPHQEGGHQADFFDSNGKYRGIKRDLAEGGIRVPTIAWWPGTIPAGSESVRAWYFADFLPSFAELADIQPPDHLDGVSFVAGFQGNDQQQPWKRKGFLYWEFYEGKSAQAVRFGKWKAIRSPMLTGSIELYDLSWDHDEDHNYAPRRPDLVNHATNLFGKLHQPDPNWKLKPAATKPQND